MTWNFKPPGSTPKSNNGKHGGFRKYNSLNNLPAIRKPNWIRGNILFQGDIDSNAGGVYDRSSDSFSGSNADAHLWAEDSDLERWDIHVTSLIGHVTSLTGHVTSLTGHMTLLRWLRPIFCHGLKLLQEKYRKWMIPWKYVELKMKSIFCNGRTCSWNKA